MPTGSQDPNASRRTLQRSGPPSGTTSLHVHLTAAQASHLYSAPPQIIPAPETGQVISIVNATIQTKPGDDGWAAPAHLVLIFDDGNPYGTDNVCAGNFSALPQDATARLASLLGVNSNSLLASANGKAVLVTTQDTDDIAFDGDIFVDVLYRVVDVT